MVFSQTDVFLCVLSSRGGCVLTDRPPPGLLLLQVGLLWRHLESVAKEMQVWARQHVGGAGDSGGRAQVAVLLGISRGN